MSGRGKKGGQTYHGDLFMLGPKSGSSKVSAPQNVGHGQPPVKKSKTLKTSSGGGGSSSTAVSGERPGTSWESLAVETDMSELVSGIEGCDNEGDHERAEGLLCGAVKTLRATRAKPDTVAWLSLIHLAKKLPLLFSSSDPVREALCSLLKRDVRESFKSKGNSLVSVLAANVLYTAYQDITPWPDQFLKVYIEDAMGERLWVDQAECKLFTDNILTAFNTILPPAIRAGEEAGGPACPSPPTGSSSGSRTPTRPDEEVQFIDLPINREPLEESGLVTRYSQAEIEHLVTTIVKEQINRRSQGQQSENITKNFIRFLTFACGLVDIRHTVANKLEMWLINPKISRAAQELLRSVCLNCNTHSEKDVEVMVLLTKQRLKKHTSTLFLSCLRELCVAHPENLSTILKQTIFNELSQSRNPNNMQLLGVMFQVNSERAASALANVFLELLLQKDCYLRALRILLREIVRCVRQDINLQIFCHYLMNTNLLREKIKEFQEKERMFTSLVDLITMAIFLSITPQVKEGFNAITRGERKDISGYKNYLTSVSTITRNCMWWLHEVVPKLYKPDSPVYTAMLYKSLFMTQSHEEYFRYDGFPFEGDRPIFFKLTSEVPVQQETLLRIFLIGLSNALPLNGQDCLTIAETLIKRAAGLHNLASNDFPILNCDKAKDFMECVWQLTTYTYPESISLPPDYQPPTMAITASYWKAWQMLLIMTAYNPEEFGTAAGLPYPAGTDHQRVHYPTLGALMEMCITNQFIFPPPTQTENAEELRARELQCASNEKQQILNFESQLAAASSKQTITEQNSLLLSTITSMDPHGPLRRPPQQVLEQLKQINTHYKIGHLLCRSRKPDFLLDILQRQGTNQAMPWLADLVENSEGSFSVLPVQCLCEFLLNDALAVVEEDPEAVQGRVKKRKAGELLLHLQQLLQNPNSDPSTCLETLDYFLARLSSINSPSRLQALAGLRLLLTPSPGQGEERMEVEDDDGGSWLLHHLPNLPCFPLVYRNLANSLRQACQVETDSSTVSLYIRFLSNTSPAVNNEDPVDPATALEDLADLALDLATVIVERSGLLPAILPGSYHIAGIPKAVQDETYGALLRVFYEYMLLVRKQKSELGWSESQDLINVLWHTGETATLHILVVHAQIILLTYGDPSSEISPFTDLLRMWFPPGQELPRAYLVDTSEEAHLIQDWLKLKMIRSSIPVLVDSALRDLDPQQLVLFIQSFGIPTESMSKLLQTLDTAVAADLDAVNESVLDKAYMGQLVAVQHKRGATGGLVFASALKLNLDLGDSNNNNAEVTNVLPELNIPPRSTAMIPPAQIKTTILQIFDVGSPARMTTKERQDTFRTLQKFIVEEITSYSTAKPSPMLEATLTALQEIIQSQDLSPSFLTSVCQNTPYSVGLFRLLTNGFTSPTMRESGLTQTLLTISKKLQRQLTTNKASTPLVPLLATFIKKIEPGREEAATRKTLSLKGPNLEADIKKMAHEALQKGDTKDLVSKISSLLLQDRESGQAGLLVDWLELLEPTIISTCPELQMKLVFGKTVRKVTNKKKGDAGGGGEMKKGEGKSNCKAYLLSLLTHQASYTVLRSTVSSLLSSCNPHLDPGAVLDFLSACIHIPRLWQGRDQRPPKNEKPADVLQLEPDCLVSLVEYIISEATESEEKAEDVVKQRIDLLVRCLSSDEKTAVVSKHLVKLQEELQADKAASTRLSTVKIVLMELYMKIPGCFNSILDMTEVNMNTISMSSSSQSVMDCYTHTLLSALSQTQGGKQWASKMLEQELAARKLMASHPIIFLRNLALLASCLQGRTSYEFSLFRSRNHLTLFTILLGLMELARPHIFNPQYSEALEAALTCYVDMIEAYLPRRDSFIGIIDRSVQLMSSWQQAGGAAGLAAAAFMRKHAPVLLRLAAAPGTGKVESIRALVTSVTAHCGQDGTEAEQSAAAARPPQFVNSYDSLDSDSGKLLTALTDAADSTDRLLTVLGEIQSASNSRPGTLIHFQEELLYHLSHSSKSVRDITYKLLLRHLTARPMCWKVVMPGYMAALQSGNEAITESALAQLPEFSVLCQENLSSLLGTVFNLGISTNIKTTPHIINAVNLLNTQAGYI